MDLSSLVFLAVVGGWAAYLLPQWVRRRNALGQARTEDRFSESARVLAPRQASPARPEAPSAAPLLRRPTSTDDRGRDHRAPYRQATDDRAPDDRAPDDRGGSRRFGGGAPARSGPRVGAVRQAPSRPRAPSPAVLAARRRACVLLVLLGACAASWGAVWWGTTQGVADASRLVPVVAVPVTVLLMLDLVALRLSARARHRARRASTGVRAAAAVARKPARGARVSAPVGRGPDAFAPAAHLVAGRGTGTADAAPQRRGAAASSARTAQPSRAPAADGTWVPVPVPPPVYTLKPAAPRPEPPPLHLPSDGPLDPPDYPMAAEVGFGATEIEDLDVDAVLARRRSAAG